MQGISILCFGASYSVAFGLELLRLARPAMVRRGIILFCGAAGLLAHTLYLAYHSFSLGGALNSLLFLSWILAVFYLAESIHHRRFAWGVFVLPVVIGLVLIAGLRLGVGDSSTSSTPPELSWWVGLHVTFLVLGAVGLCVAFVASVMYLVQHARLRHKTPPGEGLQLMSLERLETMNRRAISLAFPLFTAGLLIGAALVINTGLVTWTDPKVLATGLFWLVFALLLYLRYGLHLQGRRVALGTVVAFGLLLLAFVIQYIWPSAHPSGGGP